MAADNLMYLSIGLGIVIVFMTENPVKEAIFTAAPSIKTSLASLQTSINNLIPAAGAAPAPAEDPNAQTQAPTTGNPKRKKGHGRNRHSNFAYQMDCGN